MAGKLTRRHQPVGTGPVAVTYEGSPESPHSATVSVDYSKAPIPDAYYVADYFQVFEDDLDVVFVFGKLDTPKRQELRSKIEIYFSVPFFLNQLWKSRKEFHEIVRKFLQGLGNGPMASGPDYAPEKVQTMRSNNVLMVMSGGECVMDFYYLSGRDLQVRAPRGEDVSFEALVRVLCSPNLLLGFLDRCGEIVDSLRGRKNLLLFGEDDANLE